VEISVNPDLIGVKKVSMFERVCYERVLELLDYFRTFECMSTTGKDYWYFYKKVQRIKNIIMLFVVLFLKKG